MISFILLTYFFKENLRVTEKAFISIFSYPVHEVNAFDIGAVNLADPSGSRKNTVSFILTVIRNEVF